MRKMENVASLLRRKRMMGKKRTQMIRRIILVKKENLGAVRREVFSKS